MTKMIRGYRVTDNSNNNNDNNNIDNNTNNKIVNNSNTEGLLCTAVQNS